MNQYVLSVCIPTYNRADLVVACVEKLLKCDNPKLEIVVSDDVSPDDTVERLKKINDERFHMYCNEINGGASYNSHLTFMRAKGKYMLLISDEDDLIVSELERLIEYLEKNDDISVYLASGYRGEGDVKLFQDAEYSNGFDALMAIGFNTRYMTGVILNSALYRKHIGVVSYEEAPKIFNVYSFMYAMSMLFFYGRTVVSSKMLYNQTRYAETTTNNNPKNSPKTFYFEPIGRAEQIHCWGRAIKKMPLSHDERLMAMVKVLFDTMKVTLRIFDINHLLNYKRMLPQDYKAFLSHIENETFNGVKKLLIDSCLKTCEENGFCFESEFFDLIKKEPMISYYNKRAEEIENLISVLDENQIRIFIAGDN